jgi:hypothetical protein
MKNTNVNNFHTGVILGNNASLYARSSGFINLRGGSVIDAKNPKKLSFK